MIMWQLARDHMPSEFKEFPLSFQVDFKFKCWTALQLKCFNGTFECCGQCCMASATGFELGFAVLCPINWNQGVGLVAGSCSGEISVHHCWKCSALTALIIGFLFIFRATRSGGQTGQTSYNLFAKSSFNQSVQRQGARLPNGRTCPFFIQSRFYLDIPQVSHLLFFHLLVLFLLAFFLLLLERRFLMLFFCVTGAGV